MQAVVEDETSEEGRLVRTMIQECTGTYGIVIPDQPKPVVNVTYSTSWWMDIWMLLPRLAWSFQAGTTAIHVRHGSCIRTH